MKIDVGMWTHNSAPYLPTVLPQIERVLRDYIGQKIIVDDHSKDKTRQIARNYGWDVYPNPTGGVAGGSNEVLRHVKTEHFAGFEHDIKLAQNWASEIVPMVSDEKVAIAQGIRVYDNPTLEKLGLARKDMPNPMALSRQETLDIPIDGFSFDNNLFRTSAIKGIGGFPYEERMTVDLVLRERLRGTGWKWRVNPNAISTHLRMDATDHFRHQASVMRNTRFPEHYDADSLRRTLRITITSPLAGTRLALRLRDPKVVLTYPEFRVRFLAAVLIRRRVFRQAIERAGGVERVFPRGIWRERRWHPQ